MGELAYIAAGFSVGTIIGLTGVGGGSLMTPLLIFFFGVKPYLAVGTDHPILIEDGGATVGVVTKRALLRGIQGKEEGAR